MIDPSSGKKDIITLNETFGKVMWIDYSPNSPLIAVCGSENNLALFDSRKLSAQPIKRVTSKFYF